MTTSGSTRHPHECDACATDAFGAERRAFLREAARAVGAALVLLGARPADALARPLDFTVPNGVEGHTRRYPIPAADGATIDRDAEVILVRWQGAVYALALACPHQKTVLRWQPGDARFQCPKHKSRYRPDGSFIEGRATRGMDRYAVTRDGAEIVVDLAVLHRETGNPAGWKAASVTL
jgi:nitrite reductase/ring-hydroxylating ferredoxin subunit